MICSFIPGRIRLRSPRFTNEAALEYLLPLIKSQPGIREIASNPDTGSLLITYDPQQIDQQKAMEALALLDGGDDCSDADFYLPDGAPRPEEGALAFPALPFNREAAEYAAMIGAFAVCTSSAFLRSKGLHIYSGLTLAGLTVQHLYKYRRKLLDLFTTPAIK